MDLTGRSDNLIGICRNHGKIEVKPPASLSVCLVTRKAMAASRLYSIFMFALG